MKTIVKPLCAIVMGASVLTGCGHDASYSKIKKSGTLVVGMQANYAPFSYYKDGKLTGYDVDVARLVAKKLGLKIKFRTMDNDRLVKELDAGKIDMTGNQQEIIYKTLDADTQVPYYFSTPYKYSRLMGKEEGFLVGISSGAILSAAISIAKKEKNKNIVTIFPDSGERYLSTDLY